ncbi:Os11g0457500 [Oryza sativa Japonica Group]|uniref:Os11g0457500 protein n=1 Tax=Oryza sativa subsp. japonica TaxID=39947 RepID=A0A0P0Y1W1_ORYSJ|nr:hypothetical protein EE612_055392 [Oryza sativa]BAT13933.1 Os11g0457500 [Oryza sativa Japonica Group]
MTEPFSRCSISDTWSPLKKFRNIAVQGYKIHIEDDAKFRKTNTVENKPAPNNYPSTYPLKQVYDICYRLSVNYLISQMTCFELSLNSSVFC